MHIHLVDTSLYKCTMYTPLSQVSRNKKMNRIKNETIHVPFKIFFFSENIFFSV